MKKILLALALLLLPAVASAQSPFPVYGIDYTANNSQATAATGHARARYNTGTGNLELSIATAAYDGVTTLAATQTLTNKTLTAPVLGGTVTGTYTLGGTPTIASPIFSGTVTGTYTLSAPILSGSVTGTYTLAGTPSITSPTINGGTWNGTLSGSLMKPQRITNNSGTPAASTPTANVQFGVSPTAAVSGGDVGGFFTLTTGTGPTAFGSGATVTVSTITWNTTFSAAPKGVPMHPCNTAANGVGLGTNGISFFIDQATCTTTQCTVKATAAAGTTPTLAASTAYQICYTIIQ